MVDSRQKRERISPLSDQTVPAQIYTEEYYTTCCDGYDMFSVSLGRQLPLRLLEPLRLANLKPNSLVLDVGCGRGELIYHLARSGHTAVGLDYAPQGVKIARDALGVIADFETKLHLGLNLANAKHLPFSTNSVDGVFMLDVVEHLFPAELDSVLREIHRVLKPQGRLIIHTMPNTWYYTLGYPLYRLVQRLRGIKLPSDPRNRWEYQEVHVNEQNPVRLFRSLQRANFVTKVWLKSVQNYGYERNKLVHFGMRALTRIYPFKLVFCNDLFAIATKPAQPIGTTEQDRNDAALLARAIIAR